MKKHANLPVFIPHLGCKFDCSFCNQKTISGRVKAPALNEADDLIKTALAGHMPSKIPSEIAFFGGSFTAIDRDIMLGYLKTACKYIGRDKFDGIRISTRPDCITPEILDILKEHHVTAIELGAQSMNDNVLLANRRGHTYADTVHASKLIREYGFSLGLQVMTGLYKSGISEERETIEKVLSINPDTLRIYPTMTLRGTYLEKLYKSGEYMPHTLKESVEICSYMLGKATEHGINVIRLGLHSEEGLAENTIAGAYHPAFRELCESKLLYDKVTEKLAGPEGKVTVRIHSGSVSKLIGQKRENIIKFNRAGWEIEILRDDSLGYLEVEVSC